MDAVNCTFNTTEDDNYLARFRKLNDTQAD